MNNALSDNSEETEFLAFSFLFFSRISSNLPVVAPLVLVGWRVSVYNNGQTSERTNENTVFLSPMTTRSSSRMSVVALSFSPRVSVERCTSSPTIVNGE